MGWDFKKELGRKFIHLLSIFILVIYLFFASTFSHRFALFVLAFFLIISIEFEYFRIETGKRLPIIHHLWQYKRASERNKIGGEVFFLIGAIICFAIFDLRIAAAAILMTTFGDMSAALIGKRFGKIKIMKNRTLEGILSQFAVDLIIGFFIIRTLVGGQIWWTHSLTPLGQPLWLVIFGMAAIATLVETLVYKMDDNLLVPLFAGFAGQVILFLSSISLVY